MGYDRTVLPSGVRVVSERLEGARSVSIGAWVGTGSRDESADLNGATHFLEHLLFKGTPSRSALEIAQSFDAIGGDINAFTTREFTCFHARTLGEDLPLALGTIGDLVQNASLAPDDVEAERSVVMEEIAMHEDTPDDIVFDVFHETIWPDHPLGRRVQGLPGTVEQMSREAIAGFFHRYYTGDNIVVAASGEVDHAQVVGLVEHEQGVAGIDQRAVGLQGGEDQRVVGDLYRGGGGAAAGFEKRAALEVLALPAVASRLKGSPEPPIFTESWRRTRE